MVINNNLNRMSCSNSQNGCKSCQKKYNCLPYTVNMLEKLSSDNLSIIETVVKNLEVMQNLQEKNNEILSVKISQAITILSEQVKEEMLGVLKNLNTNSNISSNNNIETYSDFTDIPSEENSFAVQNTNEENKISVVSNNELELSNGKVWKEKKGLFGKTKWVEEDINKGKK